MKIRLKKFLNKHKNRIFSFIAVIACIPLLSFNAFAFTSYDNFPCNVRLQAVVVNSGFTETSPDDNNVYSFNFGGVKSSNQLYFYTLDSKPWSVAVDTDIFDYFLICSVYGTASDISNFTYFPSSMRVTSNSHSNTSIALDISDINFYHTDTVAYKGFSSSCKVDLSTYTAIRGINFYSDSTGTVSQYLFSEFSVIALPKGMTNGDANQAIVNTINNQTSVLGGKIDDTNDFINNGNTSTGGIVSGNNSAIDNLDDVVSEYRATEETFFNDFNTNQQAITSDIVGWSWGGLVNCANWVGDTLTSYYNNMGDFRQYIIYPLMLGIALFFLGRGGSIVGHLFRKPTETTVNTKSVFRREGNTRYTTTTTSRQGGVWRK